MRTYLNDRTEDGTIIGTPQILHDENEVGLMIGYLRESQEAADEPTDYDTLVRLAKVLDEEIVELSGFEDACKHYIQINAAAVERVFAEDKKY